MTARLMATVVAMTATVLLLGAARPRPRRPLRPITLAEQPARLASHRCRVARLVARGALATALLLVDPMLGVVVVLVMFAAPRMTRLVADRRHRHQLEAALPDAIEMLILVVHAGLTPHQAIGVLARDAPPPTRFGFVEVQRRVDRGASLPDALAALPELLGPRATAVADTLAIAERHGTPIALALEQLANDVRERRRRQAEAAARTLPVKLSFPLVMCTLPAFVLVAIVPAVLAALRSLGDSGL